jgi:hypothetical protein
MGVTISVSVNYEPTRVFDKVVDITHSTIDHCVIKDNKITVRVHTKLKPYINKHDTRKVVKVSSSNLSLYSISTFMPEGSCQRNTPTKSKEK